MRFRGMSIIPSLRVTGNSYTPHDEKCNQAFDQTYRFEFITPNPEGSSFVRSTKLDDDRVALLSAQCGSADDRGSQLHTVQSG